MIGGAGGSDSAAPAGVTQRRPSLASQACTRPIGRSVSSSASSIDSTRQPSAARNASRRSRRVTRCRPDPERVAVAPRDDERPSRRAARPRRAPPRSGAGPPAAGRGTGPRRARCRTAPRGRRRGAQVERIPGHETSPPRPPRRLAPRASSTARAARSIPRHAVPADGEQDGVEPGAAPGVQDGAPDRIPHRPRAGRPAVAARSPRTGCPRRRRRRRGWRAVGPSAERSPGRARRARAAGREPSIASTEQRVAWA